VNKQRSKPPNETLEDFVKRRKFKMSKVLINGIGGFFPEIFNYKKITLKMKIQPM